MNERVQWSCLVNKQAEILEWEDKSGATYLSQIPLIFNIKINGLNLI